MFIRKKKLKEIEQRLGRLAENSNINTHNNSIRIPPDPGHYPSFTTVKDVLISLLKHLNLEIINEEVKPEIFKIKKKEKKCP